MPLITLLSCKTCDNFQGDVGAKDADGYPTQGKCRRVSPAPVLSDTDPLIAIWPTVLQTDVCAYHTDAHIGTDLFLDYSPNGRAYNAYYHVSQTFKRDASAAAVRPNKPSEMVQRCETKDDRGARLYNFTVIKPVVQYACKHCRFFKEAASSPTTSPGTCHRNPPESISDTEDGSTPAVWPTVAVNDWCAQGQVDTVKGSQELGLNNTPRGYTDPK